MTDALLTVQDIKLFIRKSLEAVAPSDYNYLTKDQLKKQLNISETTYRRYRELGMPAKFFGRRVRFNLARVKEWLITITN